MEEAFECSYCKEKYNDGDDHFRRDGLCKKRPVVSVSLTKPVALPREEAQYRTLSPRFLALMDEIGIYGLQKYGERSTANRFAKGDFSRDERTKSRSFAEHAANHFGEYIDGIKHDKFNTREHQLAAAAFNAMLEYQFYKETL